MKVLFIEDDAIETMKLQRFALVLTGFVAVGLLWKAYADDARPAPEPADPQEQLQRTLGGPERYLTHINTDKPIYKPGEMMYARGVVLHHQTNKPMPNSVTA